ncbi:MAG: tetratricopeptide repeat protein [Candidatus Sulfobium sp.]
MKDIDTSYKVLGLAPGASEAEIRLAHKELLDRIYPDLLSPKSTLRRSAREKITEVNEAYEEVMLQIAQAASAATFSASVASEVRRPEPSVLEESFPDTASHAELPASDIIEPGYIPFALAVLVLLLYVSLFGISGAGSILLAIVSGAVGWLAGLGLVKGVNKLDAPPLHKRAVAWMTAVLLFVVVISLPVLSNKSVRTVMTAGTSQIEQKAAPEASPPGSTGKNGNEKSALKTGNLSDGATDSVEGPYWLSKGKELILAGRYPEAIQALTRSIELDPGKAAVYNSRGVAFAYNHQYGRAIDDYNKAIELDPEGAYYLNRGIVYVARGNYQQAITDYKKAASLGNEEARKFFDSQDIVW